MSRMQKPDPTLSPDEQDKRSVVSIDTALEPIALLDVPSYLSARYEIPKYPKRCQRHCVRDTRAGYRMLEDG